MVPMVRYSTISGAQLPDCATLGFFSQEDLDANDQVHSRRRLERRVAR